MCPPLLQSLAVIAGLALAGVVHAAACPGPSSFTDVAQSDIFCSDAEWLRNRGVTTGCTATEYCPGLFVTRGQMALFMQRLGTTATPRVRMTEFQAGALDLDTATFVCVTPEYLFTDYPRRIVLDAHFSAVAANTANFYMTIRYNTVGSTTAFPNFINTNFQWGGMASAGEQASASTSATLDLAVGVPYRFAIRVTRGSGGTTGHLSGHVCHLLQTVYGRTGTTPPIDLDDASLSSPRQEQAP